MGNFKDERGISNLIATLILIAVAVVGGAFAYTAFRNQAQSTTTSADLQVQDISAVKMGSDVYASVTIKNVGTQRLSNIQVTVAPGANSFNLNGVSDLDPGMTGSDDNTVANSPLSAGKTYAVQITAGTPDNPTNAITKTMTVRVQS